MIDLSATPLPQWQARFADNQINLVTDLSKSMSTQPSVTYQELDDALKAEIAKESARTGGLQLSQFVYQYGEVVPFAGPVTPQCLFIDIDNGAILCSGVELWLASTPDSPGTPHASMLPALVTELVALTKGISE